MTADSKTDKIKLKCYIELRPECELTGGVAESDWGCFRGCAVSSSLGTPF